MFYILFMDVEKLLIDFKNNLQFSPNNYSKNTIASYVKDIEIYIEKNQTKSLNAKKIYPFFTSLELKAIPVKFIYDIFYEDLENNL